MDIQDIKVEETVNAFSIKWLRVRIEYEFNKPHDFDFIVPMVRGALGYSLYETYCINKNIQCDKCRMNTSCVYRQLFESPIYEGNQVKDFSIHPFQFSLDPERIGTSWNNRKISFYLTLLGRQPEMLYPIFITELKRMGFIGLGKSSMKAKRMNIYDLDDHLLGGTDTFLSETPPVYTIEHVNTMIEKFSSPSRVTVRFLTPLQVKMEGDLVEQIDFPLLIRVAARRLNLIEKYYGGENRILSDRLINAGGAVEVVDSGLEWVYHFRYSTRKRKKIPLPGIVGHITISGDLERFLSLLALGEVFHIGGKITFGLGQFITYSVV
jgi:hypothetical protein